ncbi:mucin-2-like isoform X2 [Ostrea edulis]|uniref:mucin-2-like isoform X2 n=1 Tax=Ostrea edulis TaxID=37623 RepID=UPI0024AFB075|nr:mucin-2-like isoform X2 [Ostrea edulis]
MMEHFDSEDDNVSRASTNRWSMMVFELPGSDILKTGYLKKLKTKKDKFFVLRSTSSSGPARLEYHDSEKKFKAGQLPKRQILLHHCFNINKKADTRQKNCIALYLVDECFAVVIKDTAEVQIWLDLLLEHQNEYLTDVQQPYPHYDYIWQVEIKPKGLGVSKHLSGGYRFCLQDTVCFVKNNSSKIEFEIQMMNIRRCGHKDGFFFMELGRHSPTGSGELWMQVDDAYIAQSMHEVLLSAMREPFRSRSNTSSSGRLRDAEIDGHETRSREGSHGQSSLRNKKKKMSRPGSALSPDVPSVPPISTSPASHVYENEGRFSGAGVYNPPKPSIITTSETKKSNSHKIPSDSFRERGLSNSMDQQKPRHDSFTSKKSELYGSSPGPDITLIKHLEVRSPSSVENPNSYLVMSPSQRSVSPFRDYPVERPGSSTSDHEIVPKQEGGYMDMKPGTVSNMGTNPDPGYIDMSLSSPHVDKAALTQTNSGYISMGAGHTGRIAVSAPIPIRQNKEPGYMEMGPSSQPLPQIKEGGSGEAYLPMTPSTHSPIPDTDNLRPAKMICYLSDDSMSGDLPKRSFSVGSRPTAKTLRHHTSYVEPKTKEDTTDNGRWQSAPHLIAQKKAQATHQYMNTESSLGSSPMSQSLFSEDSMVEMEYRPRATSESYRPRTSSVGKILSQSRQRSSSYGQQSKLAQLAHDVRRKVGSFESVRNPGMDKQLFHRTSNDSIGHLSISSKASSSESLRLSSRNSEYVDMHLEKSNDTGYIDMSIGTPKSRKSSACHSRSSSNQSLSSSPAVMNSFGIKQDTSPSIKIIKSSDGIAQKSSSLNVNSRSSIASRSPCGSGRESEDESYVPYAPGISGENQVQETRSGSVSDKKTSIRSNSLSSERRPGSRSGSFGSDKNPDSRSNSFGTYTRPSPRSGSFKADQKSHKGTRLGRHSPKTSTVPSETQKNVDKKTAKQSDDNQYIDYEPGTVEVGNNAENPQVVNTECNSSVVSKTTVEKPSVQLPQYSMSTDPLFCEMLLVSQKGSESDKAGENESVKTAETSSNSQPKVSPSENSNTQPKINSSENYSYMEYAPEDYNSVEPSLKSPTVARSYINKESEDRLVKETGGKQEAGVHKSQGSVPTEAEIKSSNEQKEKKQRNDSKKEKSEAVVRQVLPLKTVLLDSGEEDDGYVGLDFGDQKRNSDLSYLSKPPGRGKQADDTSLSKPPGRGNQANGTSLSKPPGRGNQADGTSLSKPPGRGNQADGTSLSKPPGRGNQADGTSLSRPPGRGEGEGTSVDGDLYSRQGSRTDRRTDSRPRSSSGKDGVCCDQTGSTGLQKKTSVSSLQEHESVFKESNKENERSCESLNLKIPFPLSVTSNQELQKQNSMPCVAVESEQCRDVRREEELFNRRSCSDLASEYEEMSLPIAGGKSSSSQQLSAMPMLNYAKLDLGSSEEIPVEQKFRQTRHPSSPDDSGPPVQGYAEIDFEMSDNLKNARSKEKLPVKFSLE